MQREKGEDHATRLVTLEVAPRKALKATPTYSSLDPNSNHVRQMVQQRLRSYARQDEKMLRPSDENVSVDQVLSKLEQGHMKCAYCARDLLLFPEARRDPGMWTLDRIENHIAHTDANVVNCCLKCNLKKRRQDTQKFLFAERLTHIVQSGKENA